MNNPFLINGYLTLNASINKVIIEKMPTDKVKEDLRGKAAVDIFSTKVFIEEIKKNYRELKIDLNKVDEKLLPQYLNDALESDDDNIRNTANNIMRLFGERLAVILLTLKKGEKENKIRRIDWTEDNWKYWSEIENVILVGGLASFNLGKKLKYYIDNVFSQFDEKIFNIILVENPSEAGIRGALTYIKNNDEDKYNIILDCGQTFIKRCAVEIQNENIKDIIKLDNVKSEYVTWEFKDGIEEKNEAKKLHEYLMKIILDTIKQLQDNNIDLDFEIVASVANYVENGSFINRGGYGKLRLITDNYEQYLCKELSKVLNKNISIKFVHDGTAMAASFSNYEKSVCISLGTAFGVGFPR